MKKTVKKAAKIAGVTCVAAGAIAIMTSTAALTAIGAGFRYVKNSMEKILKEEKDQETVIVTEEAAPVASEDTVMEDTGSKEAE